MPLCSTIGGTNTVRTTLSDGKLRDLVESNLWDGEDDELGDVVPFGDGLHVPAGVVQGQHDFPGVARVDDAGAIAQHEVFLNPR